MARQSRGTLALGTQQAQAQSLVFSNGSSISSGQVAYGDANGKIQGAAGVIVSGTPSATAPSGATNGQGTFDGLAFALGDTHNGCISMGTFGGGASKASIFGAWAVQGTAANPGATIANDGLQLRLYGHDGSGFVGPKGTVAVESTGTWSGSSTPTRIRFVTTPSTSATAANAGIVDQNQVLSWGGANNGNTVLAISGAQTSAKMQANANTSTGAAIAAVGWFGSASVAPTYVLAKSRSTTVNTQGVVTTGDTLGTVTWQGDDGTNFIEAASIVVACTGTIASNQIPGSMALKVANGSGTSAARLTLTSASATIASGTTLILSDTTASTSGSTGCLTASGGIGAAGAVWSGIAPAAATTPAFGAAGTSALAGAVTDSYTSGIRLSPGFSGAQTVTRLNYIDLNNASLSSTTLTDACVFRFDANAGTHKAVDSGTTKTSPGTVTQWIKVNVNGTLAYIPSYSSKTS